MATAYYTYQYIPRNLSITLDQVYDIEDGSISYLYIVHDYEQRRLPIIKIHIDLEAETIEKLYKYKDTTGRIKFKLIENKIDQDDRVVDTRTYFEYMFSYIPSKDQGEYLTSKDMTTDMLVDDMTKYQSFECYLIDMDAVRWFTKQISINFHGASKPAILHALLSMRDIPAGKVLATPPQDYSSVTNAIFPYGDLIGNIMLLNQKYGIYNYNPTIYYDLQYLYCINRLNPNIIMKSKTDFAEIIIHLHNVIDPTREVEGSYDDIKNSTHHVSIKQDPVITDIQQKKGDTKFTTVTTVNKSGRISKRAMDTKSSSYAVKNVRSTTNMSTSTAMAYTYAYNNLTEDQMVNNNLAKGRNVDILVNNINISMFKPYKKIGFNSDSQFTNLELDNKTYRLSGWGVIITRQGGRVKSTKYIHTVSLSMFEQTSV